MTLNEDVKVLIKKDQTQTWRVERGMMEWGMMDMRWFFEKDGAKWQSAELNKHAMISNPPISLSSLLKYSEVPVLSFLDSFSAFFLRNPSPHKISFFVFIPSLCLPGNFSRYKNEKCLQLPTAAHMLLANLFSLCSCYCSLLIFGFARESYDEWRVDL